MLHNVYVTSLSVLTWKMCQNRLDVGFSGLLVYLSRPSIVCSQALLYVSNL